MATRACILSNNMNTIEIMNLYYIPRRNWFSTPMIGFRPPEAGGGNLARGIPFSPWYIYTKHKLALQIVIFGGDTICHSRAGWNPRGRPIPIIMKYTFTNIILATIPHSIKIHPYIYHQPITQQIGNRPCQLSACPPTPSSTTTTTTSRAPISAIASKTKAMARSRPFEMAIFWAWKRSRKPGAG